MSRMVKATTTNSADTLRLLKIFGLEHRQVTDLTFRASSSSFITLEVTCEISEAELAALCDEFEKNPPVRQDFIGLTQHFVSKA